MAGAPRAAGPLRLPACLLLAALPALPLALLLAAAPPPLGRPPAVETYLRRYGYLPRAGGPLALYAALRDFQAFAGINVTGRPDAATRRAMAAPRCGLRDWSPEDQPVPGGGRARRYALQGTRWRVRTITYRVARYPAGLPRAHVDREIRKAFQIWAAASNLTFKEAPQHGEEDEDRDNEEEEAQKPPEEGVESAEGARQQEPAAGPGAGRAAAAERVHIEVRWERGDHGDWDAFDGPGGTLGHANYPRYGGAVHLDQDESWALDETSAGRNRPSVLHIAAHEIGHALGLHHSNVSGAVMAPFYNFSVPFHLHPDDVEAITALYGKAALPAAARPAEDSPLCQRPQLDAAFAGTDGYVYVLQGDEFYRHNTRRLDPPTPLRIADAWPGLPTHIDAAFTARNGKTYFFKGARYWRFSGERLDAGFPRLLRHGFPGVPDDVDAAFVWSGNGKLYFFKDNLFWKYDATQVPQVSWRYPKAVSNWAGVPSGLDAALDFRGHTYFFKGDSYYRFNDTAFAVEEAATPFPRPTAYWWFRCRGAGAKQSLAPLPQPLPDWERP